MGAVTRIQEIGSTLFVCGGFGQVYRRDESGWKAIDGDLATLGRSALSQSLSGSESFSASRLLELTQLLQNAPNFNDIGGVDETDVYVCGNGGNLFHFDGQSWVKIETGTNAILTSMHCVSEDEVLIVGKDGIVLSGNVRSGFRNLGEFFPGGYIWSVRKFRDKIYLGTLQGLYVLEGSRIRLLTSDPRVILALIGDLPRISAD